MALAKSTSSGSHALYICSCTLLAITLMCFTALPSIDASTTKLVTEFPHYQTFDSWPDCFYIGPCFSQTCDDLPGGWLNEEFHGTEPPFIDSVRHWWVRRGQTTSNYFPRNGTFFSCAGTETGPCNDFTLKNSSGAYLYAEGSGCQGNYYKILSPPIRFSNHSTFVSFRYFMHGSDLDTNRHEGRLIFMISINGTAFRTLLNQSGEIQGSPTSNWRAFNMSLDSILPSGLGQDNRTVTVQFRFIAFAAGTDDSQWRNDIAIDEFLATQAGAPSELVPYIDPPPVNDTDTTGGGITVITEGGGDGITDGQIAGIVVGVVGGLLLCCLLLIALIVVLLLIVSPRKPQGPVPVGDAGPDDL